jgi:hypothetical protein
MSEDKLYQGFILPFYQEEKRARLKAEQRADAIQIARLKAEQYDDAVQIARLKAEQLADAVQAKNKLLEAELARLKKK